MKLWILAALAALPGCAGAPAVPRPSAESAPKGASRATDAGASEDARVEAPPEAAAPPAASATPSLPPAPSLPPPANAAKLHIYPRDFSSVDPGDDEMAFDADGFDAPVQNARIAVVDRDGLVGLATVTRVFVMAHSCRACGATSRYFVARFDAPPRPVHGGVALSPVPPHAARLRAWSRTERPPIADLHGAAIAVDLDGDGTPDVALTSADHACAGTARIRPHGQSPCDFMNDVCDERWARTAEGWKAVERVSSGYCLMDGRRVPGL